MNLQDLVEAIVLACLVVSIGPPVVALVLCFTAIGMLCLAAAIFDFWYWLHPKSRPGESQRRRRS